MNKEIMYQMFVNSIKNMNEDEMKSALNRVKGMLSEDDYKKLETIIDAEKNNRT